MRSHVTLDIIIINDSIFSFQYRKRYEITCDNELLVVHEVALEFQYRKRYEITCDLCVWEAAETEGSKRGFGKPPQSRTCDRMFSAVITYPATM